MRQCIGHVDVTFTLLIPPGIACSCKAAFVIPRLFIVYITTTHKALGALLATLTVTTDLRSRATTDLTHFSPMRSLAQVQGYVSEWPAAD